MLFTASDCGAYKSRRAIPEALLPGHLDWQVFEVDVGIDQASTREFDIFRLPELATLLAQPTQESP